MNNEKWFAISYLPTGETVHCNETGDFAKYMDYQFLAEMTEIKLKSVLPERRNHKEIMEKVKRHTKDLRKMENGTVHHVNCPHPRNGCWLLSPWDTTTGDAQCDACGEIFSASKYEKAEKY